MAKMYINRSTVVRKTEPYEYNYVIIRPYTSAIAKIGEQFGVTYCHMNSDEISKIH